MIQRQFSGQQKGSSTTPPIFRAGKFILIAGAIYGMSEWGMSEYKQYKQMVKLMKIKLTMTPSELTKLRSECQAHLRNLKRKNARITNESFVHIKHSYHSKAWARYESLSPEKGLEIETKAKEIVRDWYFAKFSHNKEAMEKNLSLRYYLFYTDDQIKTIADCEPCRRILGMGEILTVEEIAGFVLHNEQPDTKGK